LKKKDKRGREKPRREISQRKLKMGCSLSLSLSLSLRGARWQRDWRNFKG